MVTGSEKNKGKKVAWGITGSGDKLSETIEIMKQIEKRYGNSVDIEVYLSKAGAIVLKYYRLEDELKESFRRVMIETDSNSPFLAGWLETGKYEFLLVAPATSNTVAKISVGIADSLLSNSAIMALKGFIPVYIMPSDYREGTITTRLPKGKDIKLRVRREDAEHVRRLEKMKDVFVLERPKDITKIFKKHFGS
jgi:archaeoflavoprotein AfpA